mmetsp:Transcript_46867/g.85904  ORF Transcript_46867/g.85904 Transcript_46867/m.85904 type:complete len:208 (-) Transcript_46867:41-664(-)
MAQRHAYAGTRVGVELMVTIPNLRETPRRPELRAREAAFQNRVENASLPAYRSLHDANLKNLWMNPRMLAHLRANGLVDEEGCVMHLDVHTRRLIALEQELAQVGRMEQERVQDRERLVRERQILSRRMQATDSHLRHVQAERDRWRRCVQQRKGLRSAPGSARLPVLQASSPREVGSADLDQRLAAETRAETPPVVPTSAAELAKG